MAITVQYDDLHYTSEGLFKYDGIPFTGSGVQHSENGALWCEVHFVDGHEHGMARDYFPSGKVKCEIPYFRGVMHGSKREWFEQGGLKKQCELVYGVLMESTEWTADNVVVEHFVRDPGDMLAKIAEKRRERFG
jgi:antitoxin component YwqK of YwqJK toxin-antitoxin module